MRRGESARRRSCPEEHLTGAILFQNLPRQLLERLTGGADGRFYGSGPCHDEVAFSRIKGVMPTCGGLSVTGAYQELPISNILPL